MWSSHSSGETGVGALVFPTSVIFYIIWQLWLMISGYRGLSSYYVLVQSLIKVYQQRQVLCNEWPSPAVMSCCPAIQAAHIWNHHCTSQESILRMYTLLHIDISVLEINGRCFFKYVYEKCTTSSHITMFKMDVFLGGMGEWAEFRRRGLFQLNLFGWHWFINAEPYRF